MSQESSNRMDALLPAEMAAKAEELGVKKANMDAITMFALAVLAGAFIALGAVFATTVAAGAAGSLSYWFVYLRKVNEVTKSSTKTRKNENTKN